MSMAEPKQRRERDADVARKAILDAAEGLFARDGFAGARIDEIAKESGYNKSLIFHYFGDKLELYRAVVACTKREYEQNYEAKLAHINDDVTLTVRHLREFVDISVSATYDFMVRNPRMARILAWEAAGEWKDFKRLHLAKEPKVAQMQVALDFIRRAQAEGLIRKTLDPKMLIMTVIGMTLIYLVSIPRYEVLFPDTDLRSAEALEHAREQMVELLIQGTVADPHQELGDDHDTIA